MVNSTKLKIFNQILASQKESLCHLTVTVLLFLEPDDFAILHCLGISTLAAFRTFKFSTLDTWFTNDMIQYRYHQELVYFKQYMTVYDTTDEEIMMMNKSTWINGDADKLVIDYNTLQILNEDLTKASRYEKDNLLHMNITI